MIRTRTRASIENWTRAEGDLRGLPCAYPTRDSRTSRALIREQPAVTCQRLARWSGSDTSRWGWGEVAAGESCVDQKDDRRHISGPWLRRAPTHSKRYHPNLPLFPRVHPITGLFSCAERRWPRTTWSFALQPRQCLLLLVLREALAESAQRLPILLAKRRPESMLQASLAEFEGPAAAVAA